MLIDINEIKVNARIRNDFGDIQELADDIKENGLINPITITFDNELIAGERRLRAYKLLGFQKIETNAISIKDSEHQLQIEISENNIRKDFTFSERFDIAKRIERVERIKARDRQGWRSDLFKTEEIDKKEKGNTRDIVAKKSGFGSGRNYARARYSRQCYR